MRRQTLVVSSAAPGARPSCEDENAFDFLDLCLSGPSATGGGGTAPGGATAARPLLRLARYLAVLGVISPVAFFVALLPLAIQSLPRELWTIYYFSMSQIVAMLFGREVSWLCLGQAPARAALAAGCAVSVVVTVATDLAPLNCALALAIDVAGVIVWLFFPVILTLVCSLAGHESVVHIAWHMTGLMIGAIPPFVAAAIYACLNHVGWGEHTYAVFIALVLWTLMPLCLKALGGRVWVKASPAAPAMGRVFWVYYCEVAFSCFGFSVFMRSSASSIGYAVTLAPVLALQVLRGTRRGFESARCMGTLTLHRLMLYLDAFAAVMGRVAAYTLHLCFGLLKLSWPQQKEVFVSRPSLLGGGRIRTTQTVNLFNDQDVDLLSLCIGFVGLVIVASSFAAFSVLLPRAWSGQALVSTAWGEERVIGAYTSVTPQSTAPAHDGAAPPRRRSRRASSWLHSDSRSTAEAQYEVVNKFMGDYWRFMVLSLLFVFSLSTLMVNLVLSIRYRRAGPDCSIPE